jgi:hypothetical protein
VEGGIGALERVPLARRLLLEVAGVLVAARDIVVGAAKRDRPSEPAGECVVVSREGPVGQRDLDSAVAQARACEEQLRHAPG